MKKFLTLFKYESHKLVVSPSTYIVALFFSSFVGAIFLFLLCNYTKFDQDVPFAQMFFRCFWLPTSILIPLVTMRSFSEDYKNGTFQNLMSVPVTHFDIVLSKFCASYFVFLFLWLLSLSLFAIAGQTASSLCKEVAFADSFNIAGGMTFVALIGLFFTALGMLASSFTENQVVSGMVTFFVLMVFFIGGQFLENSPRIKNFNLYGSFSESMNIFSQLDHFCSGSLDLRVVVFYLSSCVLLLCLTTIVIQKKLQ